MPAPLISTYAVRPRGTIAEHLRQRRNADAWSSSTLRDLVERELGDGAPGMALGRRRQRRVVVNDDDAVRGGVDVELDGVGPALEGAPKRRRGCSPGAPVVPRDGRCVPRAVRSGSPDLGTRIVSPR